MSKQISSKKKQIFKKILLFLIFELVFTGVTFPLNIFYGPFKNVRNFVVGTSMATFSHKYIARTFFSESDIQEILKEEAGKISGGEADAPREEQNLDNIQIQKNDNNIELKRIDGAKKFKGYALIIHNPSKVKVGYAPQMGVAGDTTSKIAKRYNAVAAVNGGGFSDISPDGKQGSGIGAIPTGIVMTGGELIYPKENVNYDTFKSSVMAIDKDGHLIVGGPYSINELKKKNVMEALSFSPTLVVNGKPYISDYSLQGANPRTAIGQMPDGSIIFLALDGRQGVYLGATLKDIQDIFIDMGAENAMCLDGGASTTMYYNGELVNSPSNMMGERAIPTIVYVEP